MKIKELKISNILSFAHKEDIEDATPIIFNDDLNILIGENGSGKSTTLEVINFIFKKVIFKQSDFREDVYENRESKQQDVIKDILNFSSNNNFNEFKLNKNWNYPNKERKIKIKIELEEIDKHNIKIIEDNYDELKKISEKYSRNLLNNQSINNDLNNIIVDINIIVEDDNSIIIKESQSTKEFLYLEKFNLFKNLIRIYNLENKNKTEELKDTFVMLGAYRNYENFNLDVNMISSIQQKQEIQKQSFNKGISTVEKEEPPIFKSVMFIIAENHRALSKNKGDDEAFDEIGEKDELCKKINEKISLINLKIKLAYTNEKRSRDQYTFKFITNSNREVDIKNLSAGQKAILHLVFESYGRNDLKGGVVIIDEPEIHLHYQFQHEYIKILNEIKKEQQCQYILVTHSEALINSKSIEFVKRFYLDENKNSAVVSPEIKGDDKNSIKILDNYRSTHAFFCNKVLLVEGETDKYFFQEYIKSKYPVKINQIAVLDVMGKGQYEKWKDFFKKFKIEVYFIGDFDNAVGFEILTKKQLDTAKKEIKESFIKKWERKLMQEKALKMVKNLFN